MTSPSNPQNNTDAASPTGGYNFDALAKKDTGDLTPAEAEALAYWRSEESLREYDPNTVAPEDRVVEMPDRASVTLGEVASGTLANGDEVDSNLQAEAVGMLETIKSNDETANDAAKAPVEDPAPAKSTPASSSKKSDDSSSS